MKIAYILQMADLSTENGISKKIRDQAYAWQQAGETVRVFSLAATTARWAGFTGVDLEIVERGNALTRLWRSQDLCRRILAWAPDVIYFRYAYHSPGLPALFREIPAVAEINSDDATEYALTLSRAKQLYHRLTRVRVLRAVAAFVPVTHELAQRFAPFAHPTVVLANGIDLAAQPSLPPTKPADSWSLAFIGSPGTPWHGLDRISEIAALFPNHSIDIIGCTIEDWRTSTQTTGSPPPPNLHFHGPMPRSEYLPLLSRATAALGTFGLFRKGMDEACPLKVREYLALGLPVIGACRDTDIPDSADYYLRLPNSATPLAPFAGEISAFMTRWNGQRVLRGAIVHLDLKEKEPVRLAFMKKTVAGFRSTVP